MTLSLSKALSESRLEEFIAQEEERGVSPISEAAFNETTSTVIKTPLPVMIHPLIATQSVV